MFKNDDWTSVQVLFKFIRTLLCSYELEQSQVIEFYTFIVTYGRKQDRYGKEA